MSHKMKEIIWPANELLASQEELCYIELVALYNSGEFMATCMCYMTAGTLCLSQAVRGNSIPESVPSDA
jgi:hypothetical protein